MQPAGRWYTAPATTVPAVFGSAVVEFRRGTTADLTPGKVSVLSSPMSGPLLLRVRNLGVNALDARIVGLLYPTEDPATHGTVIGTPITGLAGGAQATQLVDLSHFPFHVIQTQQVAGATTADVDVYSEDI